MSLLKIENLSPAERLFIRRLLDGLTLAQAASRHGIGKTKYFDMEHGRCSALPVKLPRVLPPTLEQRLLRRRSDWSLEDAARRAGVSHVTFLRAERAGKLTLFWKSQLKQHPMLAKKRV